MVPLPWLSQQGPAETTPGRNLNDGVSGPLSSRPVPTRASGSVGRRAYAPPPSWVEGLSAPTEARKLAHHDTFQLVDERLIYLTR